MSEYQKTLKQTDFGLVDTTCPANTWTRLGTYTVPAQCRVAVGRRYDGYAYAYMYTTLQVHGKVRIVVANAQETKKLTVLEFETRTTTDAGDKTKKKVVPLTMPWAGQDSKIITEYYPEAAQSIVAASTIILIDVTMQTT
jgi:hypothetical protein